MFRFINRVDVDKVICPPERDSSADISSDSPQSEQMTSSMNLKARLSQSRSLASY